MAIDLVVEWTSSLPYGRFKCRRQLKLGAPGWLDAWLRTSRLLRLIGSDAAGGIDDPLEKDQKNMEDNEP